MKRKGERYWFENTLVGKPIENEEEIFNKYKGLVKYALSKIKCRKDQDRHLECVGNEALLKKIRYNEYYKISTLSKGLVFRDYFMQVIKGAMIRELKKEKASNDIVIIGIADDFDTGEEHKIESGIVLSSEDAIISLKWRDEKEKKSVMKEIKPAICGNPESILLKNDLINKVVNIIDDLPDNKKYAIRDYFGLDNGINMSYVELANKYGIKPPSARKRVLDGIDMIKKECKRILGNEI